MVSNVDDQNAQDVNLHSRVTDAIAAALGTSVTALHPLSGGDINLAFAAKLADGREVFVKTNPSAPKDMFTTEARGLAWLRDAHAVRVPNVIAADQSVLILEHIRPGRRAPSFDDDLGRSLAAMHRARPTGFGLDHDNFIGRLPQANTPRASWSDFYARQRIEPQMRRATDQDLIPPAVRRNLDRVLATIDNLAGPDEPPSRLHGDLWGGNLMCDQHGNPCLIDPAVYGGHREVDLAMMRLFGGFGERTFAAYHEAFPLAAGHFERIGLYQLYPLLVHLNLFGASYLGAVASALAGLV